MPRILASRKFPALSAIVLCLALAGSCLAQTAEREWLVLVYVSAINDRGLNGSAKELINQLEDAGSSDKVAILVKYGMLEAGANRELKFPNRTVTVLIQKDQKDPSITSPTIDSALIQDMASETSLYLFARKSMLKYPSKKVMLLFFGKGEGWTGLGQDDLSQKKMEVGTLARILSKIQNEAGRKVDLLVLDADCMQTAEIVYELKDGAQVIVGSEEKGRRLGYHYDFIFQDVNATPSMDPKALANTVVGYSENLVTAAVRTDKVPAFMTLLDQWAEAIIADPIALKAAAGEAKKTFSFALRDSRDLCEFIERTTKALPEQHPAAKAGRELWRFIANDFIFANNKTFMDQESGKIENKPEYDMPRGLAIYLPDLRYDSSMYERMTFAAHSKWRDFLMALMRFNASVQ